MKCELVNDSKCLLGEDALWDHNRKRLLFIDIERHLLYLFDPASEELKSIDVGQRIGTVVRKQDGRLLLALEKTVAILDPDTEQSNLI